MGWIRGLRGEEELWKVVFIYGAFIMLLWQVVKVALRLFSSVDLDHPTEDQQAFLLWLVRAYSLWLVLALWLCAFNADWNIWGYFVRPAVILFVLFFCYVSYGENKIADPKVVVVRSVSLLQKYAKPWIEKYRHHRG